MSKESKVTFSHTMKRTALLSLTSLLLLGIVFALTSCSSEKPEAVAPPQVVKDVALTSIQRTNIPDLIDAVGTVHAAQTAQLAAQMMGNVVAVNVHDGDRIRRGQTLILIDDSQPRAAMERANAAVAAANHEAAAAQADYSLAQSTLKRYEDLYQKKSVSPQEFDEIKARSSGASARLEMAKAGQAQANAALAQARTALGYTQIRAPFDGVVTERKVDPGALAAPGMPLMTVEGGNRFRLDASVDESSIQYVKIGQSVDVSVEALGSKHLTGKVAQIVPAADPGSRSFIVKVELPSDPNIRSGLFGRAEFPRGERESIVVPRTSVVDRGQLQGVYVLGQDKIANLRYVTLGKQTGPDQVEVLSGIQPGEVLVANPGDRDLSGKLIEGVQQ